LWKGDRKLKKIKRMYRVQAPLIPLQPFGESFYSDSDFSSVHGNLPVERVYQVKRVIKYPDGRVEVREERGVVLKR